MISSKHLKKTLQEKKADGKKGKVRGHCNVDNKDETDPF